MKKVLDEDEGSFLRLVLDTVSDCLVVVDTHGEVVFINQPYCDLLGGAPGDFIGRHVRDAVSPASNLEVVAQGGPPLVGAPLRVRGREIVTRQVPIVHDGDVIGALGMALFPSSKLAEATLRRLTGEALVLPDDHSHWRARYSLEDLVGRGPEMQALRDRIRQAARSSLPVLIHGETGVGKELVAQSIHRLSARAARPFVWLNCATIPPELVASELFGYEGGAYTGASARGGKGKIELAHEGTLFLDEIGDMPLHAQAALLRFLQEGEITRVGGVRPLSINARIVCASHKDLGDAMRAGAFREDLYFRLRVLEIRVPPLRERSDLDLLVSHLLAKVRLELGMSRLSLARRAIERIRAHSWPGNVRELQACLQRAAAALPEGGFEIDDLPDLARSESPAAGEEGTLAAAVETAERQAIERALRATDGNRAEAARRLGIDRTSLYKRMRLYGFANPAPT